MRRIYYQRLLQDPQTMEHVARWVRDEFSCIPLSLLGEGQKNYECWEVSLRREWVVRAFSVHSWECAECGAPSHGGKDPTRSPHCCPAGCEEPGWQEEMGEIFTVYSEVEDEFSCRNGGDLSQDPIDTVQSTYHAGDPPPLPEVDSETLRELADRADVEDLDVWSSREDAERVANRLSEEAEESARSYGHFPWDAREGWILRAYSDVVGLITDDALLASNFVVARYAPPSGLDPKGYMGRRSDAFRFVAPGQWAHHRGPGMDGWVSPWIPLYIRVMTLMSTPTSFMDSLLEPQAEVPSVYGLVMATLDDRTDLERLGDVLAGEHHA